MSTKKIISKYRVSIHNFSVVVEYVGGFLRKIDIETAIEGVAGLLGMIPYCESNLLVSDEMHHKKLPTGTQQQKIALWCELYSMTYGHPYKVTAIEANMVKTVDFDQQTITKFFQLNEWYAKEKTIARYTRNFNAIRSHCLGTAKESPAGKSRTEKKGDLTDLAEAFQGRFGG